MMPRNLKTYGLYLFRWQLSTPILAGVLYLLSFMDVLTATIIANLLGGLVFFWVDRFIFTCKRLDVDIVKEVMKNCARRALIPNAWRDIKGDGEDSMKKNSISRSNTDRGHPRKEIGTGQGG